MENCPAKKVVAGKASEGEVGEQAGPGWGGGRNGENHGQGEQKEGWGRAFRTYGENGARIGDRKRNLPLPPCQPA